MIEHLLLGFWTAFASFAKEGIPGGAQMTAGGGAGSTANYIDEAGANNYIDEGANNNYVTET